MFTIPIDSTERVTVRFKTIDAIASGTLIRIRGNNKSMFRDFRLVKAWVETGDLNVVHRFSQDEMNQNWKLYAKLRSVAELKTDQELPAGTDIAVEFEPQVQPLAAPGVDGRWVLEAIEQLDDLTGTVISGSVKITFTAGVPKSIKAYQKASGELDVKWFDSYNYPISVSDVDDEIASQNLRDGRIEVITAKGFRTISSALAKGIDGTPVFFGDFHWHTHFSDGFQKLDQVLVNARDHVGLDFAGPGDHVGRSGRKSFADVGSICAESEQPGRFCTLPTVEVSDRNAHVHLITDSFSTMDQILKQFPDKVAPAVEAQPNRFPWEAIKALCPKGKAILRPDHPNIDSGQVVNSSDGRVVWYSFNWPQSVDRTVARSVELVRAGLSHESEQGEPDWPATTGGFGGSVWTALARGYRIGFTGSTDNHLGWPGGNALTAVQCNHLDTASVFRALYERRCYATTGARIIADARLNQAPIGSELRLAADTPRRIQIEIQGTAPIKRVQIISASAVAIEFIPSGNSWEFTTEWIDERPGRQLDNVYYYVRACQEDGHCVWLSPFWVDLL